MRALARRTTLIRNWYAFLERYPLVLGPVSAEPPFPWGLDVETQEGMDRVLRAQGPQFMVPLLGLPAISAPAGFVEGLPIGVQLIGARFREDVVLEAAEVIEARHPASTPIDPRFA
jgi:amidase